MAILYHPAAGWDYGSAFSPLPRPPPVPPYGYPLGEGAMAKCRDPDDDAYESVNEGQWLAHIFRFDSIPLPDHTYTFAWRMKRRGGQNSHFCIYNWSLDYWECKAEDSQAHPDLTWLTFEIPYYVLPSYRDPANHVWVCGEVYRIGPGHQTLWTDCIQAYEHRPVMENLSLASNLFGQAAIVTSQPENDPSIELAVCTPDDFYRPDQSVDPSFPIPGGDFSRAEVEWLADCAIHIRYVDAAGAAHRALNWCDGEGPWTVDP